MMIFRVLRGGSYFNVVARGLRPTDRYWRGPECPYGNGGFRVVVIKRRRKP